MEILSAELSAGWQEGSVTFSASDGNGLSFIKDITVKVYYGPLERTYLPGTFR